jgi:signal transduction histidine kinase
VLFQERLIRLAVFIQVKSEKMFQAYYWPVAFRHEHRLLGFVLLSIYLVSAWEWPDLLAQGILLAHFFLFILWQPLWGERDPLSLKHILMGLAVVAALLVFLNPLLLVLWKILLISLLGGREFAATRERLFNWGAILFLWVSIFLVDFNQYFLLELFPAPLENGVYAGLLLFPLLLLFFDALPETPDQRVYLDFYHGLVFALLTMITALAALLLLYYARLPYAQALWWAALGSVLFMVLLSWLWVAFAGFDDFSQLWSRRLLNIGSSFEQWLASLSQPGIYKDLTPEQFLRTGLQQLVTVPWITGISWSSPYGQDSLGEPEKHQATVIIQSLEVTVYARQRISGTHHAHVKLLIQLLEHFHQAKRREETFAQQAHLQAIHETGAKLTHDIKNLLQSLHAITSAIESVQPEHFGNTQRMLQGQLPHLTQRLKRTLDKLKQPEQISYTQVPLRQWWDNLRARYRKREIDFSMSIMWNASVPEDLFDNVVENLLENALNKRRREPDLRIQVALSASENNVCLTVCDDGSAIPTEIEKTLLSQPVPSRDGFGIGLFQAAKQTIHSSYRLRIAHNKNGQVCFELASV